MLLIIKLAGPTVICENTTAIYEVLPVESGLIYEWEGRGHVIVGSDSDQSVEIKPSASVSDISVFLTKNGCRAVSPLVSVPISKVSIPSIPNIVTNANRYCEDSIISINYTSIDTLMYSWSVTPNSGSSYNSSQSALGLDSLELTVNDKSSWPSGEICPELKAKLMVNYNNIPNLNTCVDSIEITINVDFRIDKAIHSISVEDLTSNGFGYICNLFDSRADSTGTLKANWDCDSDTENQLILHGLYYDLVDNGGTIRNNLLN